MFLSLQGDRMRKHNEKKYPRKKRATSKARLYITMNIFQILLVKCGAETL